MSDTITGYIDHVIFRNEDNGYTVMVLKAKNHGSNQGNHAGWYFFQKRKLFDHLYNNRNKKCQPTDHCKAISNILHHNIDIHKYYCPSYSSFILCDKQESVTCFPFCF